MNVVERVADLARELRGRAGEVSVENRAALPEPFGGFVVAIPRGLRSAMRSRRLGPADLLAAWGVGPEAGYGAGGRGGPELDAIFEAARTEWASIFGDRSEVARQSAERWGNRRARRAAEVASMRFDEFSWSRLIVRVAGSRGESFVLLSDNARYAAGSGEIAIVAREFEGLLSAGSPENAATALSVRDLFRERWPETRLRPGAV